MNRMKIRVEDRAIIADQTIVADMNGDGSKNLGARIYEGSVAYHKRAQWIRKQSRLFVEPPDPHTITDDHRSVIDADRHPVAHNKICPHLRADRVQVFKGAECKKPAMQG